MPPKIYIDGQAGTTALRVRDWLAGRKDLEVVTLPEELRKLKPEERVAYVKEKLAQREAMQKQIAELNGKRQAYIAEQMKKNPSAADKAFDEAVKKAIKQQAQDRGIKIPE